MKMAIVDNATVVEQLRQVSASLCGPRGLSSDHNLPEETRTALLNICGRSNLSADSWPATLAFFKQYNQAFALRLSASTPDDFEKVADGYKTAVALSEQTDASHNRLVADEWRVRALEGLAYAKLRLGDLADARTLAANANTAAAADHQYPVYVFARTTALKAMCGLHAPESNVQREFLATEAALKAIEAAYPAGSEYRKYAQEDLDTLLKDRELTGACEYANLPASD
jgi:hypothetical protein